MKRQSNRIAVVCAVPRGCKLRSVILVTAIDDDGYNWVLEPQSVHFEKPKKDKSHGKYAKARALRAKGLTIRAIAKELGYRTTSSVVAALRQEDAKP